MVSAAAGAAALTGATGATGAAAIAGATCAVLSNPIAVTRNIDCASSDPTVELSDPCNCDNGIDIDGDMINDLAAETVTITPGTTPYTVTNYVGGLVDMNNVALTQADIQALLNAAVPDANGDISFSAFLPADGVTVFSIDISDANGATASFTSINYCLLHAQRPTRVKTTVEKMYASP